MNGKLRGPPRGDYIYKTRAKIWTSSGGPAIPREQLRRLRLLADDTCKTDKVCQQGFSKRLCETASLFAQSANLFPHLLPLDSSRPLSLRSLAFSRKRIKGCFELIHNVLRQRGLQAPAINRRRKGPSVFWYMTCLISPLGLDLESCVQNAFVRHHTRRMPHPCDLQSVALLCGRER